MKKVSVICLFLFAMTSPWLFAQSSPMLANQFFQAQKWEDAERAYQRLVQEKPDVFLNWYRLGYARQMQKKMQEAIAAYQKGLGMNPNAPMLQFQLARIFASLSNPQTALSHLEDALNAGFSQASAIEQAEEFVSLKADPAFQELLLLAKKRQTPCMYEAAYRKFDFWVGAWEVKVSGQLVGKNTIEVISGGCALLENWVATNGGTGKSINFYDAALGKWKQTWVGTQGGPMEFVEVKSDENQMIFEANIMNPTDKKTKITRLSFVKQPNGDVRQYFEDSFDGGGTWHSTFDAMYVRV
ncbi:MAG: tetratricopeptide repeat protein [Rhodothermia bacterium]|nr:tetratricopeptide repeat protein [Rhodothermia bacterium]